MDPNHPLHNFFRRIARQIEEAAEQPQLAQSPIKARQIDMIHHEITSLRDSDLAKHVSAAGIRLIVAAVDEKLAEIESMLATA